MLTLEFPLFVAALVLYAVGGLVMTWEFMAGRSSSRVGTLVTMAGFAVHTTALGLRCAATGYAPMTNLYESLSFFAWGSALAVLLARWKAGLASLGAFAAPVYVILMGLAWVFRPDRPAGLMPALQSWLLPAHVMLAFLGEAWFVVGFATAVMYLVRVRADERGLPSRLPEASLLDGLSYRAISLGYPLFTGGALILGMVWAHRAWGRYWGWDPKEVWALVTFLVYSLYLHGRFRWGWKGRMSAYLAVFGFAVTMFTFLGVNLLLSGLHSYATGG